jgi:hypothetical protein
MKTKTKLIYSLIFFCVLSTFTLKPSQAEIGEKEKTVTLELDQQARLIFDSLKISTLDFSVFNKAYKGYLSQLESGNVKNNILTIIDFGKSSKTERLFVIDMENYSLKFQSLVAHGKNSGEEFAEKFSNVPSSSQSSLGLYLTGETYIGKHGLSLRLKGLETSNNLAFSRAIVVHGADYVSRDFISQNGRLGRSHGCPALPNELNEEIIGLIKEGSCLYIFHPGQNLN